MSLQIRCEGSVKSTAEVSANADNLSLAVVDFENGGRSSPRPSNRTKHIKHECAWRVQQTVPAGVTFSPETGAVLRRKPACKGDHSTSQPRDTVRSNSTATWMHPQRRAQGARVSESHRRNVPFQNSVHAGLLELWLPMLSTCL